MLRYEVRWNSFLVSLRLKCKTCPAKETSTFAYITDTEVTPALTQWTCCRNHNCCWRGFETYVAWFHSCPSSCSSSFIPSLQHSFLYLLRFSVEMIVLSVVWSLFCCEATCTRRYHANVKVERTLGVLSTTLGFKSLFNESDNYNIYDVLHIPMWCNVTVEVSFVVINVSHA
jgi:hypothetical protein